MKKTILTFLMLISSIVTTSYSRDYVVYEDEPNYVVCNEPDYVVYDEPDYYFEEPVYYYRKPVVRRTRTVVRQPRVYVSSNPAASFFSGLFGFGLGTAFGAAIAD